MRVVVTGASGNVGTSLLVALSGDPEIESVLGLARRLPADESWPTEGVPSSFYSRHKAEVERLLDGFEREHPAIRTVRLRPGLIFKRESGEEQRRLFAGRLFPRFLARRIPVVPEMPRLRFQAVHSLDVGEAYRVAVKSDVHGAFNVAAEPVLDPAVLARLLRARAIRVPDRLARSAAWLSWRLGAP